MSNHLSRHSNSNDTEIPPYSDHAIFYHVLLLSHELGFSFCTLTGHRVEHGVLHKDADGSAYEGSEEVHVDVVAGAVEPSEELDKTFVYTSG